MIAADTANSSTSANQHIRRPPTSPTPSAMETTEPPSGVGDRRSAGRRAASPAAANNATTISTIVLNSKPIQLVVALLQSGDVYHIKVVDIAPKITFLGANIDEAVHLQRQHDIVFKQLQLQSSPIEEFAPKAAALLHEQRNARPEVLAAMGDSLQLAWTDVLDLLKRRKHILDSNANLHEKIALCAGKMSALEVACRDTMIPIEIESVQEFLNKFKQLRIEVLAAVMVALKEGNELLSCLRALANAGTLDTRPDHIRVEVKRSLTQVEVWLEQLHDRRNVLELAWQTRKVQLEQCLALAIFAKELHELETALRNRQNDVQGVPNLGDSESTAQHLHVEYMQHKVDAVALRDKALKITRATEKLVSGGCFAGDEACAKAYAVLSGCTEHLDRVDHTEHALAQAREFFCKGERALGVLEKLEIEVTSARHAAGSAEALAIHTQVLHEIGELTAEPLRLGYGIINDVGRSNARVSGIERVLEDIENRKVYLEDLCSASSEKCVHITETLTMFMERHNSVLTWLVSIAEAFLRRTNDLGTDLPTSGAFLKLHHQLMADLEVKGTEINNLLISVTEILGELEPEQRRDIDGKVEALHSHWTQLKNLIEGRVDLVTMFVQFLQLADSLSNMFDYIEKMLRESPEQDRLAQLDAVWQKVRPAYEQLKSEGARFLDETSKVADPYLETKSACSRVDEILTGFSSRQFDITESWESWTHRIVEQRETELLWEQTMTENVQSINSASKLDAQLYPILTATPATSDDDTVALRHFLADKQNTVLDEINRAHLEIQQRIESTRTLNARDDQMREKVRVVLENLNGIQLKLQSVGNGYRTLIESIVDYVQRIGETRAEIERYFREQFTTVRAELVDELARTHAEFRERIMSRFRALIAQSEQIIERVRSQEPPGARDHDTDRVLGLLERLRAEFEEQNGVKTAELQQQQEVGRFTCDLREVHSSLDEVSRQLAETLAQPADSMGGAEATRGAFQYFEKTIELLGTRVANFTTYAEQTFSATYPATQSNVSAELQKLTARWTDLKDQVDAARKTIDLTVEYFKLSDKIDENYHNALNQLATITKDIPNVKTDTAVAAFNAGIDAFVRDHETPQMTQLKQLAQLSGQVYGFDKTVTTFNEHIALYQSFGTLKADIAAIAEQIRLEEEHRVQQLKLRDQLLEQQRQQSLLQQQQQDLLEEKLKLEQQLRLQRDLQQQQKEQLALELQQQREQQEKLLQLQQQQQLQQRQKLEQQLLEQQQQQQLLQAEQAQLQQQLEEQRKAAVAAADAAAAATAAAAQVVAPVDETDKQTVSTLHETLLSSSTHTKTTESSISTTNVVYETPRFVRPLCDATIQEGDRFTFECIVTGQPQPTVEWRKDGLSIRTNSDYQLAFDGAQCSLTIDEPIVADSARFTCAATNAAGTAETTAALSVQEPEQLVMLEAPVFVRPLTSGVAREGGAFEFSCCVAGNPLPTVQWFKNDLCVDHLKDFNITFNNGEARLRLEEVFLEDQAVFTCKATNPYGTEQSGALLTVEPIEPTEKPMFRVPLTNVMARVGQKIKLECTVTGIPTPELFWSQNGKPFVDRDFKLQYEHDRATLLILEAFPKDAGVYVLKARNLAGEAHSTCNVSVKGRLPNETSDSEIPSDMEPIRPAVQLPLKNTSVFEGKSVRLDCVIVGQPEPEVIWYHNDRPVKESQDVQLLFQGDRCTLVVQEAFLEDAGLYRVVAINSAGEASSSCELGVTPLNELDPARRSQIERLLPIAQPPRFDRLLSDILTDEGAEIEFECSVLGDPRPTVKWLLNNREITEADARQQSVYTPEGTVKLVIRDVRQTDKGVYTVKASNSCGEAKCFSHLIVKSVNASEMVKREHPSAEMVCPTFRELFTDQSARIDEPVKFECIVVGKPTPKIRWFFNDQPVQGKNFLASRSGDRQVLTVPAVSSETVGRIACVAENEVGKATCVAGLGLLTTQVTVQPEAFGNQQNYMEEYNTGSSNVTIQKKLYTSTHTSQVNSVENSNTLPQTQIHGYAAHSAAEHSNQLQEYRQTNDVPATSHTRSIVNFTKAVTAETSSGAGGQEAIKVQRKNLAPRFVTPFNGKIVDQGGDVVLEAIVDGYPTPELRITKNGEPLCESENVTITNKCSKISVELRNVSVGDAGRYSVLATNVAGSSNSTADVVVKKSIFPPVFGHRLQAQVVKRNERVLMDVEVSGTPTPSVAWFKDNIPIKDAMSSEFQIKQSGNNHTLIIGSVKVADAGKYMVKAVNAAGEAQSIADFAVLEPTPDRMVEVVKTVVFDSVQNQKEFSSSTMAKNISINTKQIKISEPTKSARPAPSPSKFVKSDYKESDYESDFDRKIITPVWRPSTANDSDSEPLYYKPIRPVLSTPSSRPTSQISDNCSPMPPTVFDQPPKFDGPPRPKFQPIEKPKQTSPFPQPQKLAGQPPPQTLFKPTPVVPVVRPLPQQPPQQPQYMTQFYTAVSGPPQHIASETRNQMHMRESTETSQRVVNMTQTKRIIQFDAAQSNFVQQPPPKQQPPQQTHAFPYTVSQPSPIPTQQQQHQRQPVATAATPTRFVPCESRDTNYESEVESTRIRPLWTPNASDNEEPQYRRVNAPLASRSASLPRSNGAQIQTPMEFDNRPVELPAKISFGGVQQQQQQQQQQQSSAQRASNVHKTQTLDRYSSASSSSSTTTKKTHHFTTTTKQHSTAINQQTKPTFDLKPEAPPEYGFIGSLEQQSPVGGMKASLAARTQQFMSDVASQQQQQQAPNGGGSPQAYRDESRVSQYGTKHIDPNTGLIYFKYDFGYEFGILFPGEGSKFIAGSSSSTSNTSNSNIDSRAARAKSVPPRKHLHSSADDISIPVLHERSAPSNGVRPAFGHATGYASESELPVGGNRRQRAGQQRPIEINIDALHTTDPRSGRRSVPAVQSENYWGTAEPQRSTPICTPNFLQEQLPKRPPLFITPLKDIAVVNGSMARFECIVQCDPYPNIGWSRNGAPIANDGGRYSIVFRNGVCRLTIPQAFTPDAGQYTCTGTNHLGSVSTTANLIVPSDNWSQRK